MKSRLVHLATAVPLMLAWSTAAFPLTQIDRSFSQLVDLADVILVGAVTESTTEWGEGPLENAIFTIVTLDDLDVVKGDVEGATYELRYAGGRIEDLIHSYEGMPRLTVGTRYLLFISSDMNLLFPVVGIRQGVFIVSQGEGGSTETVQTFGGQDVLGILGDHIRTTGSGEPVTFDEFRFCIENQLLGMPLEVCPAPPPEPPEPEGSAVAFPGAEGFGADATGGRAGRVIKVTNLNDSGSGSLRAALDASGPRIIIFTVGGRIVLDSEIEVREPDVTIAGQTAPGGGIELANGSNTDTLMTVRADNVIIRNIRFRPGPTGDELDGFSVTRAKDVIVDHSSFSWAVDEVFDTYIETFDFTLQWSVISESLNCAGHSEGGCHGAGLLIGSRNAGRMTFHHNLLAHHSQRNPRVGAIGGVLDFVNNVVYNWRRSPSRLEEKSDVSGTIRMNFVGNYFKPGPDSEVLDYIVKVRSDAEVYHEGNVFPRSFMESSSEGFVVSTRHPAPFLASETSAVPAFDKVLDNAGANMRLDCSGNLFHDRRDSHDQRAADDVQNGTGGIIDDPDEVGGYQPIARGTPCSDIDNDGMPDAFEDRYGFSKVSASDANGDADKDGYTNIEEYLNGTVPR